VFTTLLGDVTALEAKVIEQRTVNLDRIRLNKNQPRKYIDEESLAALTDSIKQHGVIEPILVRPTGNDFELIAGERRARAARAAGLSVIPVIVLEIDEIKALELSVIENLQREDLNPVEETDAILNLLAIRLQQPIPRVLEAIRQLYDESRGRGRIGNTNLSAEEREQIGQIFKMVGRFTPSSFHTNRIPILQFPTDLLEAVRNGKLHYTKARKIRRVKDNESRRQLLQRALRENLSVVDLEAEVHKLLSNEHQLDTVVVIAREVKKQLLPSRLSRLNIDDRKEVNTLLKRLKILLSS
jgi:ParB family chromosome partitioning protein